MKYNVTIFSIITILQTSICFGSMITGSVTQDIITTNMTSLSPLYFVADVASYATVGGNGGGMSITYPHGLFSTPPFVEITVQPNTTSPNSMYITHIKSNDATQTTVMVYVATVSSGSISSTEAADGTVKVHLLAIANPS